MDEGYNYQKTPYTSHLAIKTQHEPPERSLVWKASWFRKRAIGWRAGVLSGVACSTAVFLINISVFLWAESKNGWRKLDDGDGKYTLYVGDCEITQRLNIGIHVLINGLSTLLLSASNYCMQCMSAPTREEVDKAHVSGTWLDIGIPSVRNLKSIGAKRTILYFLLGLSSIPLHLFYNSTVFSSTTANDYYVFSADEGFANSPSMNYTGVIGEEFCQTYEYRQQCSSKWIAETLFERTKAGSMEILDPLKCLNMYARPFQSNRGSVILVGPATSNGPPSIMYENSEGLQGNDRNQCPPFAWICGERCGGSSDTPCQNKIASYKNDIASWKPFGKEVKHCLSDHTNQHCRLLYSPHLALLVIALNAVKALIMLYLWFANIDSPLMTIGDGVVSFLQRPDLTTKGICLSSKKDWERKVAVSLDESRHPKQYENCISTRFAAASLRRWLICLGLLVGAIVLVLGLMIWGVLSIYGPKNFKTVLEIGFGTVDARTLIRGWHIPQEGAASIILNVLVANIAQLVLSFIYFTYNGLFTCMSLATEWSNLALQNKGLRISGIPVGSQRSTYFLQLPYRFAIPLMITSGVLHWLVSQSVFLVNVERYRVYDNVARSRDIYSDYMTCGYSPIAMLVVIIVGVLMIIVVCVSGSVKLKSSMPVAASCSAAISAACHKGLTDGADGASTAISRVKWGALTRQSDIVGHCCITDEDVTEPVAGAWYAGTTEESNKW